MDCLYSDFSGKAVNFIVLNIIQKLELKYAEINLCKIKTLVIYCLNSIKVHNDKCLQYSSSKALSIVIIKKTIVYNFLWYLAKSYGSCCTQKGN